MHLNFSKSIQEIKRIRKEKKEEYLYNYNYVPPLAMSERVPFRELPSLGWAKLVIKKALQILINNFKNKLDKKTDNLFGLSQGSFEEKINKFLREIIDTKNDFEALLESFSKTILDEITQNENFEDALARIFQSIEQFGIAHSAGKTLKDYKELFDFIPLPEIAKNDKNIIDDEIFTQLRVAGPNPLVIQKVEKLPINFPFTNELLNQIPNFKEDSIESAINEKRMYICDYKLLAGMKAGEFPHGIKSKFAPIALFAFPKNKREQLLPIAIQCQQDPSNSPIYLKSQETQNNWDWEMAKTIVNMADMNYHEMISHLGRTHLTIEPFVISIHRQFKSKYPQLKPKHAIFRLLCPHFEGTIFINYFAHELLIADKGFVDELLMGTIDSDKKLAIKGMEEFSFDKVSLLDDLKRRGLDDPILFPNYPYRDDALMVWDAIQNWVSEYIDLHYPLDNIVKQDQELQEWVNELVSKEGGRVQGFGENGKIETKGYLIKSLTQIIFTASAQHAAVNFPQCALMSYTPLMPLSLYNDSYEKRSEQDWIKMLPPLDIASSQLNILSLLGGVYYTKLGDYSKEDFSNQEIEIMENFQRNLMRIEKTILEKNRTRKFSYDFLLPSKIPQSINI